MIEKILKSIPLDILPLLYTFIMVIISVFYPLHFLFPTVGLIICFLPMFYQGVFNKKVIILEKIGNGLILSEEDSNVKKINEANYLYYDGQIRKEKPKPEFWLMVKTGIHNLFKKEGILVYKEGDQYAPIKISNLNLDTSKVEFKSEYEKASDARELEQRANDMKNKRDWTQLTQIFNSFLLIVTVITCVWMMSVLIEEISGVKMEINDLPFEIWSEMGKQIKELVGTGIDTAQGLNNTMTVINPGN